MKRLLASLLLVGLAIVACAPDDEAVLTVAGRVVLTEGELEDELQGLRDHEDFLTVFDARGDGSDSVRSEFVAGLVLTNYVRVAVLDDELAERDHELSDADVEAGTALMESDMQNAQGVDPGELPEAFRDLLVDVYVRFTALGATFGDDQATALPQADERLRELMGQVDVEVAGRYGRWNAEEGNVVPVDGPVGATTTTLLVPGG